MAATVLESLVVPSSPPTAAPRAAAALFPLAGRGSGLIPRFRGLRCASLPLRDAASRSRMVARRAATEVVCEAQETAVQRNVFLPVSCIGFGLRCRGFEVELFFSCEGFYRVHALDLHLFDLSKVSASLYSTR